MSILTLVRVSYIQAPGCLLIHEWFPTAATANDRVKELHTLGYESVDYEDVAVPWENPSDLIHWLNRTENAPKDAPVFLDMRNLVPAAPATATAERAPTEQPSRETRRQMGDAMWPENVPPQPTASALEAQVGGDHYKKLGDYQPWEVLRRWMTPDEFRGYMKGQAIAYLARERDKGGDQDVEKAEHYLRGLLELTAQAKE